MRTMNSAVKQRKVTVRRGTDETIIRCGLFKGEHARMYKRNDGFVPFFLQVPLVLEFAKV